MEGNTKSDVDTAAQLRYIYNAYRTASLNRKYYGHKLSRFQFYNTCMEIAIAIGATSSGGIAGLAVWTSITGQYVWLWIAGVATVLGVLKPIMRLGPRIETYTKLCAGHTNIYINFKSIIEDIDVYGEIQPSIVEKYDALRKQTADLGGSEDAVPNRKLLRKLQAEVNEEISAESLWSPPVDHKILVEKAALNSQNLAS